jgi:hypothetical protein
MEIILRHSRGHGPLLALRLLLFAFRFSPELL